MVWLFVVNVSQELLLVAVQGSLAVTVSDAEPAEGGTWTLGAERVTVSRLARTAVAVRGCCFD